MKQLITQNLKQTKSLRQEFVFRIVSLTIFLSFILVGTFLFSYQYNNKQKNVSRREALQKMIINNLISNSKYGDIIYARAESIQLGKELGLIDLGICTNGHDIFERINDNRCKEVQSENIEKVLAPVVLSNHQYEVEFSWEKEEISLSKSILLALTTSLLISLLIVFPTFYYLLKKFHTKLQDVILMLLERHGQSNEDQKILSEVVPEEFIHLDKIIEQKNKELKKATSEKVYYELSRKVSHDIRSPLKVINQFAKKLTSHLSDDEIVFNHAINRINSIAEDLLKTNKQINFVNETKSIKELIQLTKNLIKEKEIEYSNNSIKIKLIERNINLNQLITIDINTYLRILSNLINNAKEAIELTKNQIGNINITIESSADYFMVFIQDNGPGINEELILKLKNTHNGLSLKGGNGIGISSAINYLKHQGGFLDIKSNVGNGTSIELFFSASIQDISQNLDFIFIDDEQINHIMWKKLSKQNNLEGKFFKTVEECLNSEIKNFEIPIFIDYFLDNQNGIKEAEKLYLKGFKTIYLCTNFQFDNEIIPSYIKNVVGKEFQTTFFNKS